jgi:predicted O-methyltransferase YrrM
MTRAPTALDYLAKSRAIPGWMHRSDGLTFLALAAAQADARVTGDLLEVGAYHGRSAILLGFLLGANERLVVCDLFAAQPARDDARAGVRHYERVTRADFERNYARWHKNPPEVLELPSRELAARLAPPFRLIHVDGSHEPHAVESDVALVHALLRDGGVAVFEDDHSVHVPRVPPALAAAFARGDLAPLAVSAGKTYAVKRADVHHLTDSLERWAASGGEVKAVTRELAGRPVLALYPLPERAGTWRGLDRKLAGS